MLFSKKNSSEFVLQPPCLFNKWFFSSFLNDLVWYKCVHLLAFNFTWPLFRQAVSEPYFFPWDQTEVKYIKNLYVFPPLSRFREWLFEIYSFIYSKLDISVDHNCLYSNSEALISSLVIFCFSLFNHCYNLLSTSYIETLTYFFYRCVDGVGSETCETVAFKTLCSKIIPAFIFWTLSYLFFLFVSVHWIDFNVSFPGVLTAIAWSFKASTNSYLNQKSCLFVVSLHGYSLPLGFPHFCPTYTQRPHKVFLDPVVLVAIIARNVLFASPADVALDVL